MTQLWKYYENGKFISAVRYWKSDWIWNIPVIGETGPIRNWAIKTILQVENDAIHAGSSVNERHFDVIDAGG